MKIRVHGKKGHAAEEFCTHRPASLSGTQYSKPQSDRGNLAKKLHLQIIPNKQQDQRIVRQRNSTPGQDESAYFGVGR